MLITVHTDGGSRSNPGPAAIGVVMTDSTGAVLHECAKYIGIATNNEAEYEAMKYALTWLAQEIGVKKISKVVCKLDSKLVVEQLNRKWKIKEDRLRVYATECWKLLSMISIPVSISHVMRSENVAADALVNQALDAQLK